MSCPLPDMTPKWANPHAVVEGVQSHFLLAPATAEAIGQHVPRKPPGKRELGVVQEIQTWHSILLRANFFQRPAELPHEKIRCGTHHQFLIQFLLRLRKVTGLRIVTEGLTALTDEQCFTLQSMTTFSFEVEHQARKDMSHLLYPHHYP